MNVKKTQKLEMLPSNEPQPSWSDSLEENPLIQWIIANGKILLYILFGLILLGILISRFMIGSPATNEADFINAEKEYLLFKTPTNEESDPQIQASALKNFEKILAAHPELHAKYDGSLAEILLIRGEPTQASDFATSAMQRTAKENDPFYTPFAQTTLAIANGQYEQALNQSKTLKEQMIKVGQELQDTPEKIPFSTLLYSLNLLRIGMLEQQLARHEDERNTWQEWRDLSRRSQEGGLPKYLDGPLFSSFENLLSEGNVTFINYIETREKVLTN